MSKQSKPKLPHVIGKLTIFRPAAQKEGEEEHGQPYVREDRRDEPEQYLNKKRDEPPVGNNVSLHR